VIFGSIKSPAVVLMPAAFEVNASTFLLRSSCLSSFSKLDTLSTVCIKSSYGRVPALQEFLPDNVSIASV